MIISHINNNQILFLIKTKFTTKKASLIDLLNLAPRVGLEPTTYRLTAECSTIELSRLNIEYYNHNAHICQQYL